MTPLIYDERRTTEAVSILASAFGGRLSRGRLLRLLYVVDRRSIERLGTSVTLDDYLALPAFGGVPLAASIHLPAAPEWYGGSRSASEAQREIVASVAEGYAELADEAFEARLREETPEAQVEVVTPFDLSHVLIALGEDPGASRDQFAEFESRRRVCFARRRPG